MQLGSLHNNKAPELRVDTWIDAKGDQVSRPLRLTDLGEGYKLIYCFQHWCPGCHARGFPTLKYLYDNLKDKGFNFAVIQTVFEGANINTLDKLRVNQEQYSLKVPFGHDTPPLGEEYPTFMEDYRSGGTPWFTLIDPSGDVVYADFRMDPEQFLKALGTEGASLEPA